MLRLFLILTSSFSLNSVLAAPTTGLCYYHIQKAQLEWVGFKTAEKVPVRGTFKKIQYEPIKARDPLDVIRQTTFNIDTSSVDSGDLLRDKRLAENFFKLMSGNILGRVTSLKGSQEGSIQVALTMNGQEKPLTLSFNRNGAMGLVARSQINILDFNGNKALQSLNKICKDLHKGKDGVSKTWSDVELKIDIEWEKSCPSSSEKKPEPLDQELSFFLDLLFCGKISQVSTKRGVFNA